jgi:cell wall-associated NlpC family hydrolase
MPRLLVRVVILAFLPFSPSALPAQITISGIDITGAARGLGRAAKILRSARDVADAGTIVANSGSPRKQARAAVTTGRRYVGVPYVWGGSTPAGFDCSGFVQYVYGKNGVPLPRTSRQMAHAGKSIRPSVSSLREGDLMLFRGRNGVINHVALYAGGNRILHSSSSGRGVGFDNLSSRRGEYFRSHLVAARRVSGDGRSLLKALERIYRDYPFDGFDPPDQAPTKRLTDRRSMATAS